MRHRASRLWVPDDPSVSGQDVEEVVWRSPLPVTGTEETEGAGAHARCVLGPAPLPVTAAQNRDSLPQRTHSHPAGTRSSEAGASHGAVGTDQPHSPEATCRPTVALLGPWPPCLSVAAQLKWDCM